MVQARDRYEALKRIADINPDIYGIIFCRTRAETKEIANKLIQDGYNADALHGDLSQAQRESVMHKFRVKNLQMLIATDVAARGLDVDDLTHVINVDLPDDLEIYTHRSGRTGRAGKKGVSISIIHSREKGKLHRIEKLIDRPFEHRQVPAGEEICVKQLFHLIDKMENVKIDNAQIDPYLPEVYKKLEGLSKEHLIKNFVALEFNRFLEYYRNARDINFAEKHSADFEREKPRRRRESRSDSGSFVRFFIDIGSKDRVDAKGLIGFINRQCKNRDMRIGKVEVLKTFSFFEVDEYYASDIPERFQRASYDGKKVKVEPAQSKADKSIKRKPFGDSHDDRNRKLAPFHKRKKRHRS
jgi:ATP-dependent RNA helicase DeaD